MTQQQSYPIIDQRALASNKVQHSGRLKQKPEDQQSVTFEGRKQVLDDSSSDEIQECNENRTKRLFIVEQWFSSLSVLKNHPEAC